MRGNRVPRPVLTHWWLCARKRAYQTRTIAELYLRESSEARGPDAETLRPYWCPVAAAQGHPHVHLGHPPHPYRRRPSQVRRQAVSAWNWNVDRTPRGGVYSREQC